MQQATWLEWGDTMSQGWAPAWGPLGPAGGGSYLLSQQGDIAAGSQGDHLEAVAVLGHDVKGLRANGPRRPQQRELLRAGHTDCRVRHCPAPL
jgi:hypothetical protein